MCLMKNPDHKLNYKFAWKGFSQPQPSTTLHCSESPHSIKHLQSLPKDLRPLAELVANPKTEESVWLNACVAAGDKSLVAGPSLLSKAGHSAAAITGAIFSYFALMLNVLTATLFSAYVAFLVSGVDPNIYMKGLIESHLTGVLMALGAGFVFWFSLLVPHPQIGRFLINTAITVTALLIFLSGITYLGTASALMVSALVVIFNIFLSTITGYCREALPKSFSAAQVAKSAVGILFIPAAFIGLLLLSVCSGSYTSSENFSTPTIDSAFFAAGILFFTIFGQSLALSLASKTSSKAACALLSTCVQLPLLLGLGFTTVASLLKSCMVIASHYNSIDYFAVMTNTIDIWSTYGPDKAAFTAVALFLVLSLALSGSYAGATINAFRAKN